MLSWEYVAQVVVSGLLAGGVYALLAMGLTLIFGVMRVINVAHGEFVIIGAYVTYWAFALAGLSPLVSLVLSIPILFVFGMVLQRVVIKRVIGAPQLSSLLVAFGVSIMIVNVALYVWTGEYRSIPYLEGSLRVGGLAFSRARVVGVVMALLIAAAFFAFLKWGRLGKAIRATAQSREVAAACGINVGRVYTVTFGLGAALAGAAGTLVSFMFSFYPEAGLVYTFKSFAVVILGGMGSYVGALAGGLILGLAEGLSQLFLSSKVGDGVAYVLLVLILLLRPQGLFGGPGE